jgi:hypothetical protein
MRRCIETPQDSSHPNEQQVLMTYQADKEIVFTPNRSNASRCVRLPLPNVVAHLLVLFFPISAAVRPGYRRGSTRGFSMSWSKVHVSRRSTSSAQLASVLVKCGLGVGVGDCVCLCARACMHMHLCDMRVCVHGRVRGTLLVYTLADI